MDGEDSPLFCFGHGLSYTAFALSDLQTETEEVPTDGVIRLRCRLKNTGSREGAEVVQLYSSFFGAHVTRPNIQLQGFHKVTLAPGEEAEIRFQLDTAQLGYYNEDMEFVVEPGELTLFAGTSVEHLPLQKTVRLTGAKRSVMGKRAYTCPSEAQTL